MSAHPAFVVEILEPSREARVRIVVGQLVTMVALEDLPDGRRAKWANAGCKSVIIVNWLGEKNKEFGCFASLDDVANAIDARTVISNA